MAAAYTQAAATPYWRFQLPEYAAALPVITESLIFFFLAIK